MFFDTHAHINLHAFKDDAEEVMRRSFAAGVGVMNVGTELVTSKQAVSMLKDYPSLALPSVGEGIYECYAVVGLHPSHTYDNPYLDDNESAFTVEREEFDYEAYKELAQNPRVVGIGECGLDYYRLYDTDTQMSTDDTDPASGGTDKTDAIKRLQREAFLGQVKLALELDKTLVIHCRPSKGSSDAYEDIIQILSTNIEILNKAPNSIRQQADQIQNNQEGELLSKDFDTPTLNPSPLEGEGRERGKLRFEVHSFTGNLEVAQKFLELGGYIGLNGIITFDKSGNMAEVVKGVPLDRIVLETDAPYLAPVPFRGKRNEPSYVIEVAKKIAELKGVSLEEVEKQAFENTKKLFRI